MNENDKLNIGIYDVEDFQFFCDNMLIEPMKRNMTGSVTVHYLEGKIKAAEMNPAWRTNKAMKEFFNEKKNNSSDSAVQASAPTSGDSPGDV